MTSIDEVDVRRFSSSHRATFDEVFSPLNRIIREQSQIHRWSWVSGVSTSMSRNGYCTSSANRMVRTYEESKTYQFNTDGTLHPNERGHRAAAELIANRVRRYLSAHDKFAVRRGNQFLFDTNDDPTHDVLFHYGDALLGDQFLAGDWDGDGRDNIGVRRGNWLYLDTNFNGAHDILFQYGDGDAESQYLSGDWDGRHGSSFWRWSFRRPIFDGTVEQPLGAPYESQRCAWTKRRFGILLKEKSFFNTGVCMAKTKNESSGTSVAKVSEISARSTKGFEDAIQVGIARASRTLRNVNSAWIKEQRVDIKDGKIASYQVNMMVTFTLDE